MILIVLMMLNPYTFLFFNVAVSYNKFFPEGKPYFNAIPQYLLAYYCLLTFTLLVLVFLVDEHQFRKVFIKHEKNKTEDAGQYNRLSLINEPSEYDDDNSERNRSKEDCKQMIACKNLSKKLKGAKNDYIVKDITFDVEKGQIMGLLGPSGAGKSTIFKLLSLLSARDSGALRLAGIDINRYWDDYRLSKDLDIGFVF